MFLVFCLVSKLHLRTFCIINDFVWQEFFSLKNCLCTLHFSDERFLLSRRFFCSFDNERFFLARSHFCSEYFLSKRFLARSPIRWHWKILFVKKFLLLKMKDSNCQELPSVDNERFYLTRCSLCWQWNILLVNNFLMSKMKNSNCLELLSVENERFHLLKTSFCW